KPYLYGISVIEPTIYLEGDETIEPDSWEYYGLDPFPMNNNIKLRIIPYVAVTIILPSGRHVELTLNAQHSAFGLVIETLRHLGSLPISTSGEVFYPAFHCVRLRRNLED